MFHRRIQTILEDTLCWTSPKFTKNSNWIGLYTLEDYLIEKKCEYVQFMTLKSLLHDNIAECFELGNQ